MYTMLRQSNIRLTTQQIHAAITRTQPQQNIFNLSLNVCNLICVVHLWHCTKLFTSLVTTK